MRNTIDLLDLATNVHWYTWDGDGDGPTGGTYIQREAMGYLPSAPFQVGYPATADAARVASGRRWVAIAYAFTDEAMDQDEIEEAASTFENVADNLLAAYPQWVNAFTYGDVRTSEEAVVVELGVEVPDEVYEAAAAALAAIREAE